MHTALAETRAPIQKALRYYLPRWMAALVVITLIEQLAMFPPAGRGFWYGIGKTADRDGLGTICSRASLWGLAACGR